MTKKLRMADLTADERERISVAVHESGHAIACVLLGGRVIHAVVGGRGTRDWPVLGQTQHDPMPTEDLNSQVAYAGPYCQARWLAGRRPTQREMFNILDRHGRCDQSEWEGTSGGTTAARQIVPLMERCLTSVTALAVKLWQPPARIVYDEGVRAALRLSTNREVATVQLALIRSGSAPGTFTVSAAS